MTPLAEIRQAGLVASLADGKLRIHNPSKLTDSLRKLIRNNKPEIIKQLSVIEESTNSDLLVMVWSPAGTKFIVQARDAEHAAFLLKMNPRPTTTD